MARGAVRQLGRSAGCDEPTPIDDGEVVAQLLGFVHRVGGEHHRGARIS